MTDAPETRAAGRVLFPVALAALALLVAGPLLAWLELVSPLLGLALFAAAALPALGALLGAVVQLARRRHGKRTWLALAIALVPLATLGVLMATRPDVPPINDVTTDPEDPPAFSAAAKRLGVSADELALPQAFVEPMREAYGDLAPLRLRGVSRGDAVQAAQEVAARLGWREIVSEARGPDEAVVEAVAITSLFRFRDDVVVRVRERGDELVVDVRSRSRVGRSDLGANAARIRAFLAALEGALGER